MLPDLTSRICLFTKSMFVVLNFEGKVKSMLVLMLIDIL